jgi:hypothetical protein
MITVGVQIAGLKRCDSGESSVFYIVVSKYSNNGMRDRYQKEGTIAGVQI